MQLGILKEDTTIVFPRTEIENFRSAENSGKMKSLTDTDK